MRALIPSRVRVVGVLGGVAPADAPGFSSSMSGPLRMMFGLGRSAPALLRTPSRRGAYVRLIMDAKQEETRERRVREAISLLEQSQGGLDDIPPFIRRALTARPKAWQYFQSLAPSYRRHYVGWIMQAKQEETRERRLREAVLLLAQNKKLGLK
jgi:uncharacterized protein YdeI (YjbR/CyaY-like superfamily)